MGPEIEIIIIAVLISIACSIPGVFLVLRGSALITDAISHTVLLGIVLTFFIIKEFNSFYLTLGAAITGIVSVILIEFLTQSRRMKQDAAIGVVFTLFFALGVILISRFINNVHLDADCILFGELAFAPFDRFSWKGVDFGPYSLFSSSLTLLLNGLFVSIFYKELKCSTFDKQLAYCLGLAPTLVHYSLIAITSVTAVSAFNIVGSILVIALMIVPPATAYLLTRRVSHMIFISIFVSVLSTISGYLIAIISDSSIAGSIAVATGIWFVLAWVLGPNKGIVTNLLNYKKQKRSFAFKMLTIQLLDHEGTTTEKLENSISNLTTHMMWEPKFAADIITKAIQNNLIERKNQLLKLTMKGRALAEKALMDIGNV